MNTSPSQPDAARLRELLAAFDAGAPHESLLNILREVIEEMIRLHARLSEVAALKLTNLELEDDVNRLRETLAGDDDGRGAEL